MVRIGTVVLALAVGAGVWRVTNHAAGGNTDWPAYAGDKASTKYSPLDQITRNNVSGPHAGVAAIGPARGTPPALSRRAGAGQLPAHAARRRRPAVHEHGRRGGDGARSGHGQDRVARHAATPDGRAWSLARQSHAQPRLLDRRQGRAHRHQRRREPRRAEREDRQAVSRLRRRRPGGSDQGLRATHHRLALDERPDHRAGRHRGGGRARAGHRHPQRDGPVPRRRCRPTTCAATTCAPASTCGRSTSCRARASSATRRG